MTRRPARSAASELLEGPWALPDGWRWERLGDIADVVAGQSPRSEDCNRNEIGLPFYQGKAEFGRDTPVARNWCATPSKIAEAGDLLISVRAPVGPTNLATERCGIGRGLAAIRPKRSGALWLRYWLSASVQKLLEQATGTTFEAISGDVLRNHLCPVPPIEVQERVTTCIEELFTELDDGEAALARARSDVSTWRKALLKAAVTGELTADWRAANPPTETGADLLARILANHRVRWLADPRNQGKRYVEPQRTDSKDLFNLPKSWIWANVAQLTDVTGGVTKNAKRDVHLHRLPYLRVGNVYDGRLDLARVETIGLTKAEISRVELQRGDLLIVEGNGSIDQIGRSAIWNAEIRPCVHQNHLIKARPRLPVFAELIQAWLQSLSGRKELERKASSTSGLHTLSITKVQALRCPLPPLSETYELMRRVKSGLRDYDVGISANDDIAVAASNLRQSVLAAAFRGELVA